MKKLNLKGTLSLKKETISKFEMQHVKGGEDRTYTTLCGATCEKDCYPPSVFCTGATRNLKC
jgi:hypothetical protein